MFYDLFQDSCFINLYDIVYHRSFYGFLDIIVCSFDFVDEDPILIFSGFLFSFRFWFLVVLTHKLTNAFYSHFLNHIWLYINISLGCGVFLLFLFCFFFEVVC